MTAPWTLPEEDSFTTPLDVFELIEGTSDFGPLDESRLDEEW